MSPFEALISSRRSVRKFKPEVPDWSMVESMLASTLFSPSPSNSRPVRFFGVKSDDVRQKLNQALADGKESFLETVKKSGGARRTANLVNAYHRFSEFMFNAPLLFAVGTVDVPSFSKKLVEAGILEKDARCGTDASMTVGLSLKAFILRGQEQGIGSCILTAPLVFIPEAPSILSLEGVTLQCFVASGFPDEEPGYIERSCVDDIYREI